MIKLPIIYEILVKSNFY